MAALSTNVLIDAVAVKGELLALPVLMASLGLSLVAVRDRSWRLALAAGLLAGPGAGLQAEPRRRGRLRRGAATSASWLDRPADPARAGPAGGAPRRPASRCRCWPRSVGRWRPAYACTRSGTPSTASAPTPAGCSPTRPTAHPTVRAGLLVLVAVGAGMLLIIGGFVVHVRDEWRADAPLTAAIAAMLVVDVVGLVLGGSYWRDYLFPLLPGDRAVRRPAGRSGPAAAVSPCARSSPRPRPRPSLCLVGWVAFNASGLQEYDEHDTGVATARGGRARATPWSCTAAGPTCSSRAASPRRTPTCGACRCAPSTRTWPSCDALISGDDASDLDRGVGRLPALGRAGRRPPRPAGARTATSAPAPPAGTARSGCSAASTGSTPEPDCHGNGFTFSSGP